MADEDTNTSDERVDMDAERINSNITAIKGSGRCFVSKSGMSRSNAGLLPTTELYHKTGVTVRR